MTRTALERKDNSVKTKSLKTPQKQAAQTAVSPKLAAWLEFSAFFRENSVKDFSIGKDIWRTDIGDDRGIGQ
ncbi:MAG: hypothetical protein LBC38_04380 [Oscillospiraceae bacterium]|jgi:hypothetical protein|nr:hypothetical protein [Oscillospiraceae bacterium]